ncbi:inorganic phosphate transporter [Gigaspora margarita]|uniref:Inorganic phosphate transporter n=1 Tax=Gigaspora margarita TaxID=4874 RepID=A0A8H4AB25_GIGMA|nr:inorganic phosphate transporter [Gigaspora margarita]
MTEEIKENIPQVAGDSYDIKRREALERIDNAKFGWFHIRACLVSGVGFFTDAYDIFAINLVAVMLGYVYFGKSSLPPDVDMSVKIATPVGTLVGQFAFGILADVLGRKKMYGVELLIIVFATFASCLTANSFVWSPVSNSFVSNANVVSTQGLLVFWRVILGIGIGGDYPLSAVITSEFATTARRGAMMSAVFAMQGIGILVAAIVSTIVVASFHSTISPTDFSHIDYAWRIVTGLGAVPGVVALYFRLTIPETPRFTMDIERNIHQATQDIDTVLTNGNYKAREQEVIVKVDAPVASFSDFFTHFGKWENGKVLFGTAFAWFALDVAFYGIGLNNNIILKQIGFLGDGTDPYETLFKASVGNIIIALLGTVPGYWVTVFTIDLWGRRPIQIMGFACLTALFIVLGFGYYPILHTSVELFIFIFTLSQFFFNFGPNTTTFVVPGEIFPTRYRSTGHGISAASGKLGAIISQVGFFKLKDIGGATGSNAFIDHLFKIFAVFMLLGLIVTYFCIPETKNQSLESLSNENQDGFVKRRSTDA